MGVGKGPGGNHLMAARASVVQPGSDYGSVGCISFAIPATVQYRLGIPGHNQMHTLPFVPQRASTCGMAVQPKTDLAGNQFQIAS